MKAREREIAGIVYLLALVPLWGILFDGILWLVKKESSRTIAFHAHQAIVLHFILLLVFVFFAIFLIIGRIIGVVSEDLGAMLKAADLYLLAIFYALYVFACLYAVFAIISGNDQFKFPVIGSRLMKSNSDYNQS